MEQGYQVRELQPGLWAIEDGHVRMFLLEGSEKALLLDTGFGTAFRFWRKETPETLRATAL